MALIYRKKKEFQNIGIPLSIQGHDWFKWVDSAIEQSDLDEITRHMSILYMAKPSGDGGAGASNLAATK
jgi:hypothetical protein